MRIGINIDQLVGRTGVDQPDFLTTAIDRIGYSLRITSFNQKDNLEVISIPEFIKTIVEHSQQSVTYESRLVSNRKLNC